MEKIFLMKKEIFLKTFLIEAGYGLLSHALRRNTISAKSFNGRVRNGIVF